MNRILRFFTLFSACFLLISFSVNAQETEKKEKKGYDFTLTKELPHTQVKSQARSGTCWSFAGKAFMEAEILRLKGETLDLSEMFAVRNVYSVKAKKYVRLHGSLNLGPGGGFSDVLMVAADFGIVPESAYTGLVIGEETHIHGEMDEVLKSYSDAILKKKNKKLTPVWHDGLNALLDTYLGEYPSEFLFEGKKFTPKSFAESTGFIPEDYIELTSFTHQPYYKPFIMEIPDNWMWSEAFNLPLEELMETIDFALNNGYTVGWDADVSEKGFGWKNGVAVVPEEKPESYPGKEKTDWDAKTEADRQKAIYSFEEIVQEKQITAEVRQTAFDNFETTDDHLMLIVGIAKDQNGSQYYKIKNSWGTTDHVYKGYFYTSIPYMKYKTVSILIHKEALPKHIEKKLDL
jgi:bleomycin hydrolase